jgi:hypothetical protein
MDTNSTNDEILKLSREMQEIASDMRKEELLERFLRQLGFKHDFGCWRLSGERNSLFLVVINNRVEIGLCIGNKERFTYSSVFKFLAGSLYANTITEDNVESVKEDIGNIVENFKKQETPDYVINRFSVLDDFELVVTLTNKDVDLLECLKNVKLPATDRHFILFDTAIYGGFCEHRFIMKGIIDGEIVDEIYSMPEEHVRCLQYSETNGYRTIYGDYDLRKQLNLLLKKLADCNFFQCNTENLDNILSNIDTNDVEFKHPEYSVTEF